VSTGIGALGDAQYPIQSNIKNLRLEKSEWESGSRLRSWWIASANQPYSVFAQSRLSVGLAIFTYGGMPIALAFWRNFAHQNFKFVFSFYVA